MSAIAGIQLDVVKSETFGFVSDVTNDPVESGGSTSDNIDNKSATVTMSDCIISDTPLGSRSRRFDPTRDPSVAQSCYLRLLEIRDNREPVAIETTRGAFSNMAIESLSFTSTPDSGESLRFSVSFKEIKYVTNARTFVRVSIPGATGKKNLGSKASKDAAPSSTVQEDQAPLIQGSALRKVLNGFGIAKQSGVS